MKGTLSETRPGFIYVMRSPAVTWSKIGLSERAPNFRARELSADGVYGQIGPWSVVDYRQVTDMFACEKALHQHFAAHQVAYVSARELFDVAPDVAQHKLIEVAEANLLRGDTISRLRIEDQLTLFLQRLFRETGLSQFLSLQECWTLSLFPSTAGGRYFTLNIDRHEVAYVAPIRGEGRCEFMLFADELAITSKPLRQWLRAHDGQVSEGSYASQLEDGVVLRWVGDWETAQNIFDLPKVRRALVAYWYDALLNLRDRGKRSVFARHHNHNAVQELMHPHRSETER